MMMDTRRNFIGGGIALAAGLSTGGCSSLRVGRLPFEEHVPYSTDVRGGRWYRGNTHLHTYLSDGRAFSEEAVQLYKDHGYDFLVLTDHNCTHTKADNWFTPNAWFQKNIIPVTWARFKARYPSLLPSVKTSADGMKSYLLPTFDRLVQRFDEDERFLLISGNEQTLVAQNGDNLHCNVINTRCEETPPRPATAEDCLDWCVQRRNDWIGAYSRNALFTLNHPLWRFYDIRPEVLMRHPSIRFFEVANVRADPMYPPLPQGALTYDKFWDVANALRAQAGLPLVYALASDDTHDYEMFYRPGPLEFAGYCMVRAECLTMQGILDAFWRGDFYATTGVRLKGIWFDREKRELTVDVDPSPGEEYRIEFLGTRRGADTSVCRWIDHMIDEKSVKPHVLKLGFRLNKRLPVYSEAIGEVFATHVGTHASYRMRADDWYVRARVSVVKADVRPGEDVQHVHVAWTQPVS